MEIQLIKKKNTKCTVKDSSLCKWMNKKDCSECYLMELSDSDQADALKRWEVTQSLLPDGIDELAGSDTCQFCKGEPHKKTRYATVDLAHPEPESTKGMFFGFGKKVRSKIGSLLPVSIACCDRCHNAFLSYDLIKYALPVLITLLAILLLAIPATAVLVTGLGDFASYIFIILMLVIGIIVGRLVSSAYMRKKSKDVRLNIFEIPLIAEMEDKGWFLLQEDTEVTRLVFTRKKFNSSNMKYGENDADS
jgi:hypothetical protein